TGQETATEMLPAEGASLEQLTMSFQREIIIDALKKNRGNVAATSRYLKTTERILRYTIRKLNIDPKQYRR
ncbi:MAG: AAA family ATPase, partial [Lentisphaerae bacterium]